MMTLDNAERIALEMIRDWEKERYCAPNDYADREIIRLARFVVAVLPVVRAAEAWRDEGDGGDDEIPLANALVDAIDSLRRARDGGGAVTRALYNENDPFAAQWLRNLIAAGHIAPGEVDDRSIQDLTPADVAGPGQRHFFAGIGGWSYALKLAGVSNNADIWTGSCPCQPFSSAGARGGTSDPRHLWPAWFALIRECRPPVIFGEQVSSPDGLVWLDLVYADLERRGYAVGSAIASAAGVTAPHRRERIYFVAHANRERLEGQRLRVQPRKPRSADTEAERSSEVRSMGDASTRERRPQRESAGQNRRGNAGATSGACGLEYASSARGRRNTGADDCAQGASSSSRAPVGRIGGTMKPDTRLRRIRSFCEKVIARAKAKEERYGKVGSWEDQVRRDMAERVLRMMEKT